MVKEDAENSRREGRKEDPQNDGEGNCENNSSVRPTEPPAHTGAGRWTVIRGVLPEEQE